MNTPIHIIGGGLAGLVAAISAAEAGAPVVLHEATDQLGGRARSDPGGYATNLGPHVLLNDGAVLGWLRRHDLVPDIVRPVLIGNVVVDDRGAHRVPPAGFFARVIGLARADAPVDATFGDWASDRLGEAEGALLARYAGLYTYHHDPGSLSAAFVWDRGRRVLLRPDRLRSVVGGWSCLVDGLAHRAREVGVTIELGASIDATDLPSDGPTIVTAGLPTASRLLGEELAWTGARTALLDVALARGGSTTSASTASSRADGPPVAVDVGTDLRTCCFVDRVTAHDPSLAPAGVDLVQTQLGIDATTTTAAAIARIEHSLDVAMPGWRADERWRRELVVRHGTGAVDHPGTTWRDRPAIDRGDGRYLAGDMVAAPGLLSEVAVNSAVRAAQLAIERRRHAVFAPGWPAATLTPESRVRVLAAALPGASVRSIVIAGGRDDAWTIEAHAEDEPYFQLRAGRFHTIAIGAAPEGASRPDGSTATVVRVLAGSRFGSRPTVAWLMDRLARHELRRRTRSPAGDRRS